MPVFKKHEKDLKMNMVSFIYGMFANIFFIFMAVLQRFNFRTTYSFDHRIAMDVFKCLITTVFSVHEEGITTPTFERQKYK